METIQESYDLYHRLVWAIISRKNIRGSDAEDLFMEIWEAVVKGYGNFQGFGPRKYWIAAIANNRCISYFRRRREILLDDLSDPEDGRPFREAIEPRSKGKLVRSDAGKILSRAIRRLDRRQRFIIELVVRGVRYREIARLYNDRWSENIDELWVGKKTYEIRRQLRRILQGWGIKSVEDIWE